MRVANGLIGTRFWRTRLAVGCGIAAAWLVSCGEPDASPSQSDEVAVGIDNLLIDPRVGSPVVLLSEEDGERQVAIWIGLAEAHSIASQIDHRTPLRPNTHDLAKELVEELHGVVVRVVVTELRENIYYAVVEVRNRGRILKIDARPSDAIALALRFSAPVFVRANLLTDPGDAPEPRPEERST